MIRKANYDDINILTEMGVKLFGNIEYNTMENEINRILRDEHSVCYILFIDNIPVGFIYCELRYEYTIEMEKYTVGYLEGLFIEDEYAEHILKLFEFFEKWAKAMGCNAIAVDHDNKDDTDLSFYEVIGMHEVLRIIHFRKEL